MTGALTRSDLGPVAGEVDAVSAAWRVAASQGAVGTAQDAAVAEQLAEGSVCRRVGMCSSQHDAVAEAAPAVHARRCVVADRRHINAAYEGSRSCNKIVLGSCALNK